MKYLGFEIGHVGSSARGVASTAEPADQSARFPYASREQLVYADVLEIGMRASLALIVAAFLAYLTGLLPAAIPVTEMPHYWSMSAHKFLVSRGLAGDRWPWVRELLDGDFAFAGLVMEAAVTMICYIVFVRVPLKKRDWVTTAIVVAEIVVLALAASGLVATGE